jgi:succinate-semialdehyde dehydrogenase/glutarate-semialdehyde dehydrogenase
MTSQPERSQPAPKEARLLIAGQWIAGSEQRAIADKYTGETATMLHVASSDQVHEAVTVVEQAQQQTDWPAYERYRTLARTAQLVTERKEALVECIVTDSGFTRADALGEIRRAEQTLLLSGEAAKQLTGEMVPLESAPGVTGRIGFTMRFPIGVVAAITPFNSPLNTVAHKVGPALAGGNGVVLKPANATPLTANALGQILLDAGVPAGMLAIVHGSGATVGQALLSDPRIGFYTFTGSSQVGLAVQRAAGLRPTQLELGSIATTIVCGDADIPTAVAKIVPAAFRKAGQVCTSVQRLYVDRAIFGGFVEALVTDVTERAVGDPREPDTLVGPLISPAEAERVSSWVATAEKGGASVLTGGDRSGSVVNPAVLVDVAADMDVVCREVFGPVVNVLPFTDLAEAIRDANATEYGLAAGVFTRDLDRAMTAALTLRFGGVHVNETSSSRVDLMPYGGVKMSGRGREGPLYAAREMTEERLVTISHR